MAYLRKNDLIMINNNNTNVQALVVDIQFRRFRKSRKDRKTNETKSFWKSVPYAVCQVMISSDPEVKISNEFLIPGYKLKNIKKNGKSLLILRDKYIAEFAEDYGNDWVANVLLESKVKRDTGSSQQSAGAYEGR